MKKQFGKIDIIWKLIDKLQTFASFKLDSALLSIRADLFPLDFFNFSALTFNQLNGILIWACKIRSSLKYCDDNHNDLDQNLICFTKCFIYDQ